MADETSADINNPALQPNGEDTSPAIGLISQYVKDLSFENPNAPAVYQWQDAPQVDVQFNIAADSVGDSLYEVTLKIDVTSKTDQGTSFVIELKYAGLFGVRNVPDDQLQPFFLAEAPRILFPFARRVVADAVRDGGFAPLLLEPIDFHGLFMQQVQQVDAEQARIFEVDHKAGALIGLRRHIDLQRHFIEILADAVGGDVELHIDLRCVLPLVDRGRVRVFERQILHILRNQADRRARVFAVRLQGGIVEVGAGFVSHVEELSLERWKQYPHPQTVSEPRRTVAAALSSAREQAQWALWPIVKAESLTRRAAAAMVI